MKKLSKKIKDIEGAILLRKNKLIISKLKFHKLLKGQVLVKIIYTSICGSQLMEIEGKRGKDKYLPHLLGHEASGIVIRVGPGVTKFRPEDKVVASWIKTDNKIYGGFKVNINDNKKINAGPITTFSNYSVIYQNRLIKKPQKLSMREASLYGCAVPTGAGIVFNQMKPKKNNTILVLGLGAIGLCAIAALKCCKIKNIIAVDKNENRLKIAKKLGAKYLLNTSNKNFNLQINKWLPKGFDFCIESAGKTETIEFGFSMIKDKIGKLFFASHPDEKKFIKIKPHDLIRGRQIFGSWGGNCDISKDIPIFVSRFKKNNISFNNMLSKDYKLSEINSALIDFKKGKIIRPIIKFNH